MEFLKKITKHSVDRVLTPTAPKIGSRPLPEVGEGEGSYRVDLQAARDDDASSSASGRTPSPVIPFSHHRKTSLFSRSSTPRAPSRPTTPICIAPPPQLVAPTPRWKTVPPVLEQNWNIASPTPTLVDDEDDVDVIKRRNRSQSLQAPSRASSSRHSERLSPELWKEKQEKPRTIPTQASSRASTSRSYSPDVPLKPARKSLTPAPSERQYDSDSAPPARAASRLSSGSSRSATRPAPRKGILKPSKPSPVDLEKLAACDRDTPTPSSPSPESPLFYNTTQFGLHWQLLPPKPGMPKHIRYDVALGIDSIRKYDQDGVPLALGARDMFKVALEGAPSRLTRMRIKCPQLPYWPIDVRAAGPEGVTCGEVFIKLFEVLDAPLTDEEKEQLITDQNRDKVEAAFAQRCRDVPHLDQWVRKQGLKRIDLLCGKRMFGGLRLHPTTRWDLWELTMRELPRA